MDDSQEQLPTIDTWILEQLNIHVYSPCIPQRQEPLDCYMPSHVGYALRCQEVPAIDGIMQAAVPGAAPRQIQREDGVAWVYDRDVVTTWRLPDLRAAYEAFESALARETVWIAIEAFLDANPDIEQCDDLMVLQRFRDYLSHLGSQQVTVTTSSLVQDMLAAYRELGPGIEPFSCSPHTGGFVAEFVRSRECFFRESGRQPYIGATFAHCEIPYRTAELNVELHFTWSPPLLHFHDLRNAVYEGDHFSLQPFIAAVDQYHPICSRALPPTAEFYIGPTEPWLNWDDTLQSLQGIVPHQRACEEGALRLDAYTIPLHVMAILTKHFAGDVRLETVVRCTVPLTVKRRPDQCAEEDDRIASPPLRTMASQTLERDECRSGRRNRALCESGEDSSPSRKSHRTSATPSHLMIPAAKSSWQLPMPRSRPLRACSAAEEDKENTPRDSPSNMKELSEQLKRKAEEGRSRASSPLLRMDALSLARLYDSARLDVQEQRSSAPQSPLSPTAWSSNNPYRVFQAREVRTGETPYSPLRAMDERLAYVYAADVGIGMVGTGMGERERWPSFQSDL
ncbi:hypothetical protein LTR91_014249 [Friedmanniomyces endolithicus]|uniref:Uncharacterized protein n=1 Tax=Friedmanniomyces endolithicus TaxID=329885 RepID=A0AAN6KC22_9PEZI|nr:hypothetical protein LTR94_005739 [Friedmanniomyces endolithicus]KAK0809357.1 hypothetical protein LTR59_002601 [Friedmanniomyces endolithicus]KAK0819691.1 hypothetical protein LTR38_000444 [Friedmanniomyces endolithicus]KAK0822071.1 hypothetical protein LTR75_000206 [Friedmanniomyces endolithicus]KAK0858272.1 hypothetical protein LTR03_000281 [Friedmanniomyces endolithicus]